MLDVTGMKCGGCSASVKRILLSNAGVQHAAVNLLTETAVVKLRPAEASAEKAAELLTTKVVPSHETCPSSACARPESFCSPQKMAKSTCHNALVMTCQHDQGLQCTCAPHKFNEKACLCISHAGYLQGFPSKVRDAEEGLQDSAESVQERKQQELQRSLWDLGLAWGLVLVCCTHHLGHWLHGLGWHGACWCLCC